MIFFMGISYIILSIIGIIYTIKNNRTFNKHFLFFKHTIISLFFLVIELLTIIYNSYSIMMLVSISPLITFSLNYFEKFFFNTSAYLKININCLINKTLAIIS